MGFCDCFLNSSAFDAAAGVASVATSAPVTPTGVSCARSGKANGINATSAHKASFSLIDDFTITSFSLLIKTVGTELPANSRLYGLRRSSATGRSDSKHGKALGTSGLVPHYRQTGVTRAWARTRGPGQRTMRRVRCLRRCHR